LEELQKLDEALRQLNKDENSIFEDRKDFDNIKNQIKTNVNYQITLLKKITELDQDKTLGSKSLLNLCKKEIIKWKEEADKFVEASKELMTISDNFGNNYPTNWVEYDDDFNNPDLESYSESDRIQSYTLSSDT
jgi:hypothetical protein